MGNLQVYRRKEDIMKKIIFLRNLPSLVIAIAFLVTSVFGNYLTTSAAELSLTDNVSSENSSTEAEIEKDLVQYDENWTIFQYLNSESRPMFDIKYMDKTVEELAAENLSLQYRIYYKNEETLETYTSNWYNSTDVVSEEAIAAIESNKDKYYIQYQIVDDSDTSVSKSYTLLIWPQEEPFPYIVSSNIDLCEVYDLNNKDYFFTVTLKYNDRLNATGAFHIESNCNIEEDLISSGTYIRNSSFSDSGENVEVNGKTYRILNGIISFDLALPTECYVENIDNVNINYLFEVLGLEGLTTHKKLSNPLLSVCTPAYSDDYEYIYVDYITITAPSNTVEPNSTLTLTATVFPENATDKTLTWISSNEDYATVDENGTVTTTAGGIGKTVTITAISNSDEYLRESYVLSIVDSSIPQAVPVTAITLNASSNSVIAGEKVTLTATVAPENATNKSITWSSSNTTYATVDREGIVTTTAAGAGKTVTITAKANDGSNITANYNLQIKPIPVTSIHVTSTNSSIAAGGKVTLSATVSPTNATNKSVTWSSSNTKYATVDEEGVVTTKKAGAGKTVTITAKSTDGSNKEISFKLKIKKVSVKKLKITGKKTVKAGKKLTLKVKVTPSNATNKSVKWTSSNKKYATVNAKGVVTAKKAGKGKNVRITATAKDGSKKKVTFKIRIK